MSAKWHLKILLEHQMILLEHQMILLVNGEPLGSIRVNNIESQKPLLNRKWRNYDNYESGLHTLPLATKLQ